MGQNTEFFLTKTEATSNGGMIATKHKLATEAGLSILRLGGNAVDAGIAACFAVGVVEPESIGIGGFSSGPKWWRYRIPHERTSFRK